MKKWGLLIGFLFSWLPSAFAAETMTLTLQDALILALKNNLSLKAESFNRDIAYSGIMIQKGEFDPFFGTEFAESALKTQSPYYSFTILNPEQKVIDFNAFLRGKATTGTGYELRWNNERFRGDSSVLKINPYYKSELSLTLTQPILKGFGIDVQRARVYASEYTYEISKLNYTDASEEIALRTITAYWTVVASKSNLEVFELSLSLAQKIHEEVKAKIRAGLLAQVEVYQAEA
ncbi:MAG: TolC family protein, partial [bacterium]